MSAKKLPSFLPQQVKWITSWKINSVILDAHKITRLIPWCFAAIFKALLIRQILLLTSLVLIHKGPTLIYDLLKPADSNPVFWFISHFFFLKYLHGKALIFEDFVKSWRLYGHIRSVGPVLICQTGIRSSCHNRFVKFF